MGIECLQYTSEENTGNADFVICGEFQAPYLEEG